MNKSFFVAVLALSFIFLTCQSVKAGVSVSTGGSSDGSSLVSAKGPATKAKKAVSTKAKGGSIAIAAAKSVFTKTKITHGNKVVSSGTAGDEIFTHVDANSFFGGTATFISNDGEPVENFIIDIGLDGSLKCKTPDPEIPEFFSLARMATEVIVDGDPKFSGYATQDGAGAFSASGDISTGDFTTGANTATLKKSFPINLGTLTDGQKLAFFFLGSTLVSYGSDVPITFCAADFFNTDTFAPAKGQAGKITISAASKTVDVQLIDDVAVFGDEVLFIETDDEALLDDLDSIKVIFSAGGGVFNVIAGDTGDIDEDGIADVVLTASNQNSLVTAIHSSFNNTLIVFGTTGDGEVFTGTLDLSAE